MQGFGHLAVGAEGMRCQWAIPIPRPPPLPTRCHLANSQLNVTPPSANLIVKAYQLLLRQVTSNPHKAWTQLHLIINSVDSCRLTNYSFKPR